MSDIKERVREWLEVPHYRFVGNEKRLAKCNYCGVMAETWSDVIHNYKCPHALLATAEREIAALAAAKQRIEKLENRVDDLAMKVMTAQSLMTEKQLYEYDELVRQRRQESIADLAPAKNAALGGQESE